MIAYNIKWDVDDPSTLKTLPVSMFVPDNLSTDEEISDYITEATGFCHKGFLIK